jgi:hypothetical protein
VVQDQKVKWTCRQRNNSSQRVVGLCLLCITPAGLLGIFPLVSKRETAS